MDSFKPFDRFIIRTPRYPFSRTGEWKVPCDSFLEDIYVASKDLFHELQKKGATKKKTAKIDKAKYKYWSRACSRSTPFGLFSCCSIGFLSNHNDILVAKPDKVLRHSRLDMDYLCDILHYLESIPEIQEQLLYYPNDSLYIVGDKLRYIEYGIESGKRVHHIQEVDNSIYLQSLLEASRKGLAIHQLAELLCQNGIESDAANSFIIELINNQILISEIEPTVTGSDVLDRTISVLEGKNHLESIVNSLKDIRNVLTKIDFSLLHENDKYEILENLLSYYPINHSFKSLLQVDTFRPTTTAFLSSEYTDEIEKAIRFLIRLHDSDRLTNRLREFSKAFIERYERQEIPLLEALDEGIGIGYPVGVKHDEEILLFKDYQVGHIKDTHYEVQLNQDEILILKKICQQNNGIAVEIELSDNDCPPSPSGSRCSNTISALFQVFKGKESRIYLKSFGGSTAASLIGRFSYLESSISSLVEGIIEFEEMAYAGTKTIAEIVHLPESRIGNISHRSVCRKNEVHYLGNCCLDGEGNIPVSDLLIAIQDGSIYIRSKTTGKEIIPILSNAHNYLLNTTPAYQFLCDYQQEFGRVIRSINTDTLLSILEYLPRIRYGKVILGLRTWLLRYEMIFPKDSNHYDYEIELSLINWSKNHGVPNLVTIKESDNSLFIDMRESICRELLFDTLYKKRHVILEEFLYNDESSIVSDGTNSYCSEFIVPFYKVI